MDAKDSILTRGERRKKEKLIRAAVRERRQALGCNSIEDVYAEISKSKQRLQESGCKIRTFKKLGIFEIILFKEGTIYRGKNPEWFVAANEALDWKDQHDRVKEERKIWRNSPSI